MIGLQVDGRHLLRAYSMASANHEEHHEFFSIKVQDGALTCRLQHFKSGDSIIVNSKPTGTLIHDNLVLDRFLYLWATETRLAPFLSIIKAPDTNDRYEKVILMHGCPQVAELAYDEPITHDLPEHEFFSESVRERLIYYPTVTREPFRNRGCNTDLIASSRLLDDIGLSSLSWNDDRVMMCRSLPLLRDLIAILRERNYEEGNHSEPGHYVVERALVENRRDNPAPADWARLEAA
jgi:ferredoxin--NADP+ reductase